MSVARIEVDFDTTAAIAEINQLNTAIQNLPKSGQSTNAVLQQTQRGFQQTAHTAAMLTNAMGVAIPGGARMLTMALAGLSGGALPAVAMGVGLVVSQLVQWKRENEEVASTNRDLAKSIQETNDAFDKHYEKMEKIQRARGLIGLSGTVRSAKELSYDQADVNELRSTWESLIAKQNRLTLDLLRIPKGAEVDGEWKLNPEYVQAAEKLTAVTDEATKARTAYLEADQQLTKATEELAQARKDEAEKTRKAAAALAKAELDKWSSNQVAAMYARNGLLAADADTKRMLDAGVSDYFARQNEINFKAEDQYFAKRESEVEGLKTDAANLYESILRQKKDYLGVLGIELSKLDELKAKYYDNAEAITAIEEKKKLLIMQTNSEIASDSEAKFERTADAIEGFFNRVFLTARSFSDVWRQLWGQIANYAVNQVAKIVAAWWTGQKSMTQASVTGGYGGMGGGGASQGIQSVLQFASAVPMASTASAGGGMSAGLSDYYSYLMGGNGGVVGNTGTGTIQGGASLGSSIGGFLTSPSGYAMLGGLGLSIMGSGINNGNMALAGISGFLGGGFTGMAVGSTLLAGTAIGAWAGPIGALAGLGIGLFMAARKRNQQKKQSTAVHASYNEIQARIIEEYEAHKRGYDDATSTLTSALDSSVISLQSMGGPGSRTISEITAYYKEGMAKLKAIQARREGRLSIIAGLPLPEFHSGSPGIIQTGSSQPFLAMLKPKEAVLNERAAAALGDQAIKKLNQGQGAGGMEVHMHFANVYDPRGFERVLTSNLDAVKTVLRRAAKDQGLPVPV